MRMQHLVLGSATVLVGISLGLAAAVMSGKTTLSADSRHPLLGTKRYAARLARLWRGEKTNPVASELPVAPGPADEPASATDTNALVLQSDLLRLELRAPPTVIIGQAVTSEVTVVALADCANVTVIGTVPEAATFVFSEPAAHRKGQQLTWTWPALDKRGNVTAKFCYKADREGDLAATATMSAAPRGKLITRAGRAALVIEHSAPATVRLGADIAFDIIVRNRGVIAADQVVLTVTPTAADATANQKMLLYQLGTLGPGRSQQVPVSFPATQRGKLCQQLVARAAGGAAATNESCTTVVHPGLELTARGAKQQFLGRTAAYEIVVNNTGDIDLPDVFVTEHATTQTRITKAPGGSVNGPTASWHIPQLARQSQQTLNLELTTDSAGSHCMRTTAESKDGVSAMAETCTLWKGVPALRFETKADPETIAVGDTITFTIRVANQGTAIDSNIKLAASFGKPITPLRATGPSAAADLTLTQVSFAPLPTLPAKQSATYTITAKAVAPGDHRLKLELSSDALTSPLAHEESTQVY